MAYKTKDQKIAELEKQLQEYDSIFVGKDDDIRALKQMFKELQDACVEKVTAAYAEMDKCKADYEALKKESVHSSHRSRITGDGERDSAVVKKFYRGDLMMDDPDVLTPFEEMAFFNTKDLIIRIHPRTGRKLSSRDVEVIKEYLKDNYYYETLLDVMEKERQHAKEVLKKAETLGKQPAGTVDTMSIIERAHHLGLTLMYQYNNLF